MTKRIRCAIRALRFIEVLKKGGFLLPVIGICLLPIKTNAQRASDNGGKPTSSTAGLCAETLASDSIPVPHLRYADSPLNGVSTYDLVLISQHILGIKPLDSPYKMIAADGNRSGSITTFDIVEIRKLILGIYTKLPGNTSWRFVPRNYVFPDPQNPFGSVFPESGIINPLGSPPVYENEFVAIKVGDVNSSVIAKPAAERPAVPLSWSNAALQVGEVVTVPIVYQGEQALDAVQLGLRFDPQALALISPSKGDLPGYREDNFNLSEAAAGKIRTLWLGNLAEEERIEPGAVLFHLSFRVLSTVPESGLPLWFDDEVLHNAAWRPDGTECALNHEPVSARNTSAAAATVLTASVRPNPTRGEATLAVQAASASKGKLVLYGAYGKRLASREVTLVAGAQEFSLPELASLPAGVYLWKVEAAGQRVQGHIVKQ